MTSTTVSYRRQTDDFIAAITTGREPLVSVSDGYQALRVSHAILESARTGSNRQTGSVIPLTDHRSHVWTDLPLRIEDQTAVNRTGLRRR